MASEITGALPPPSGITANFVDPPSLLKSNAAQHATCLTLVSIFVAIRLYTRLYINKAGFGLDDIFCILSYLLDWVYSISMIISYSKGLGRHIWDVPATWIPGALKYLSIAGIAYMLLSGCIKLTFLFCYRNIFSTKSKTRMFINGGIAFVACFNLSLFFVDLFLCKPIQRAWDVSLEGECLSAIAVAWLSAVASSAIDIYIFLLPIAPLWGLNLDTKKKLKVIFVFSLGLFACIASLVRLGMTPILQSSLDATWNSAKIGMWSAIEVDIGIICSCLIVMPAFLERHFPKKLANMLSHSWTRISSISTEKVWRSKQSFQDSETRGPHEKGRTDSESQVLVTTDQSFVVLQTTDVAMDTMNTAPHPETKPFPYERVNADTHKQVWNPPSTWTTS